MVEYPEMMTVEEAADFLRVSRDSIYRRLRGRQLPGLRVGHEWRISKSELLAIARNNDQRGACGGNGCQCSKQ